MKPDGEKNVVQDDRRDPRDLPRLSRLIDSIFKRERRFGFAVSEERLVGVMVREKGHSSSNPVWFGHLLDHPHDYRGCASLMEPLQFFTRRAVVPPEFRGREREYIQYNRPDLIPLPESDGVVVRHVLHEMSGETLVHGIRGNRLQEFLDERRREHDLPNLTGVIPPVVALGYAFRKTYRPLTGRVLAVLIGKRTTRYLAFRDGELVNSFDDVHRPGAPDPRERFVKTFSRVLYHMETDGLGGFPQRVVLMGERSYHAWTEHIPAGDDMTVEFFDLPGKVGIHNLAGIPADMAIIAIGAAFAGMDPALPDVNFIGVSRAVAARRFDAYDMLIYTSLAAMLALSFVTLHAMFASRILTLRDILRSNTETIRTIREDVESRRGVTAAAEKIILAARPRVSDPAPEQRRAVDVLPEFLAAVSETIPDGMQVERLGAGDLVDAAPKPYRSILPKNNDQRFVTVVGRCRAPDKAMDWAAVLAQRLSCAAVVEEMKIDETGASYRFKIIVDFSGAPGRA